MAAAEKKFKFRDIRLSAELSAEPGRVYDALTSSQELRRWWAKDSETEVRNLGKFNFKFNDEGSDPPRGGRGIFVDLEPGKKVAWMWDLHLAPKGTPPLSSAFIESTMNGTHVTIVHAGFSKSTSSDHAFELFTRFWKDRLDRLTTYLSSDTTSEHGATKPPKKAGAAVSTEGRK